MQLVLQRFFNLEITMKNIEVCYTPDLIHLYDLTSKIVVAVDVLRATSTMVAGLAKGVEKIIPLKNVEETKTYRTKGYILAGERNGKKIEGFDLGNSPFEFMDAALQKPKIAMTTTNGTRTIRSSEKAEKVVIGSFLNLEVVSDFLAKEYTDIVIHCAGWKGRYNLEDSLFAGALIKELFRSSKLFSTNCDSAIAALSLYERYENNLSEIVQKAAHVNRLSGLSAQKDVEFCIQKNVFNNVPLLSKQHIINL